MLFTTSLLTAILAATNLVEAARDEGFTLPYITPDFKGGAAGVAAGLNNALVSQRAEWDRWGSGWIPERCKFEAKYMGLSPWDYTVINVHYDDCPDAFVMCIHKNSPIPETKLVDQFGKLPVKMRSYIQHVMASPGTSRTKGWAAYTRAQVVNILMEVPTAAYVHEVGHAMDRVAYNTNGAPFSSSAIWKQNYYMDSAVANHAESFSEGFADTMIVALYDKVVAGGIGTIQPNWKAIFHQYATIQGYCNGALVPGGKCVNRIANSQTVPMGDSSRRSRHSERSQKPDVSFHSDVKVLKASTDTEIHVATAEDVKKYGSA